MEKDDGRKDGKAQMTEPLAHMSVEELNAEAAAVEEEAWECGDLEERLEMAFHVDYLRALARRKQAALGLRAAARAKGEG